VRFTSFVLVAGLLTGCAHEGSAPEITKVAAGGWSLGEVTDPIDDTRTVALTLGGPGTSFLAIRCKKDKTELLVETRKSLTEGVTGVRYRIDGGAPSAMEFWDMDYGRTALFSKDAVGFARELVGHHTFLFEYSPALGSREVLSFDITGLGGKLPTIATACDWSRYDAQRKVEQEHAAAAHARQAARRAQVAQYVHRCTDSAEENFYGHTWCVVNSNGISIGGFATRDEALDTAVEYYRQ
jgi:hypothetical protein